MSNIYELPDGSICEGPPEKCVFYAERRYETLCNYCQAKRSEVDWSNYARGSTQPEEKK